MKKLKFRDIACYLPYGLAIEDECRIRLVYGGYIDRHEYGMWSPSDFYYKNMVDVYHASNFKPILRPFSDLYRTVTHNGEEIEPIVECAKICDNIGWHLNDDPSLPPSAVHGRKKEGMYERNHRVYFMFKHGSFIARVESGTQEPDYEISVKNQVSLFDFLNELKIDYRNLIDAGLAIDANKLENNPYK
jgi:hypothetical protein